MRRSLRIKQKQKQKQHCGDSLDTDSSIFPKKLVPTPTNKGKQDANDGNEEVDNCYRAASGNVEGWNENEGRYVKNDEPIAVTDTPHDVIDENIFAYARDNNRESIIFESDIPEVCHVSLSSCILKEC